ncbi:MAG: phosphatidylserine decarboxylase [Xanthomonadales bacterium]|nr:phosphatidylserine decarboxylase [Gammaproteobacteria bacterium]MBT8054698.1 phosphatidylserine decarboxylase [Gammaproteobacteria bacterium]NND57808.1 phosphatidylserine decarboxylase [Xanthomonadales bacterium]NNJ80027.1 phosphatidylserine decarboxylase [Xanthomonadales bacterium]NNK51457.1 phosphatidylserine decarboxylase [Xanthomonadales bacterium]
MFEKLFSGIQYLLPHHLLSRLVHAFMRIRLAPVKNTQIALIGSMVGVEWAEARIESISEFEHFNDFFTRELRDGARPIDPDPLSFVCPSDGKISQSGRITNDRIVQAKGVHYSVRSLLANDASSPEFLNGYFHTVYLSPRDYHRVHMPFGGTLQRMIHVPGRLFSVAPYTVRQVPNLFARNERVISLFETPHGLMGVILVGAMLVSSMETVWSGVVTPPRGRKIVTGDWSRRGIELAKGAEMGRFNMGSTVILLLPAATVSMIEHFESGDDVVMGQRLGRLG